MKVPSSVRSPSSSYAGLTAAPFVFTAGVLIQIIRRVTDRGIGSRVDRVSDPAEPAGR